MKNNLCSVYNQLPEAKSQYDIKMNERRIKIKNSVIQNEGKEALYDYYQNQKMKKISEENLDKS